MAELVMYNGTIIYNKVAPTKKGGKYASGMVVMLDENGIEAKYNMISFRSQVIKQFEAVGEKGFAGKKATFWGTFKQNTWNGNTTWQLHVEKLEVQGYEQLAKAAEEKDEFPSPPSGVLKNGDGSIYHQTIQTHQPVQPDNYVAPQPQVQVQPPQMTPTVVEGGYVAPQPQTTVTPVRPEALHTHMQAPQAPQTQQQPTIAINSENVYDI